MYHQNNAEFLSKIQFITLIPSTISLEKSSISTAIKDDSWIRIDDNYQYVVSHVEHMGINQRWMVVYSNAANNRAVKSIARQVERAHTQCKKALYHLQAQRFACQTDAQRELDKLTKKLKYHNVITTQLSEYKVYEGKE